jgi:hypothetical protein
MLINYILISHGYPSIIIKWTEKDKEKYFNGIEEAESWLYEYYPEDIPPLDRDNDSNPEKLQALIRSWLFQSLDYHILIDEKDLLPVHEIVSSYGYNASYARQLISRWQVIAKKIWNTRYSKPAYFRKWFKKR